MRSGPRDACQSLIWDMRWLASWRGNHDVFQDCKSIIGLLGHPIAWKDILRKRPKVLDGKVLWDVGVFRPFDIGCTRDEVTSVEGIRIRVHSLIMRHIVCRDTNYRAYGYMETIARECKRLQSLSPQFHCDCQRLRRRSFQIRTYLSPEGSTWQFPWSSRPRVEASQIVPNPI